MTGISLDLSWCLGRPPPDSQEDVPYTAHLCQDLPLPALFSPSGPLNSLNPWPQQPERCRAKLRLKRWVGHCLDGRGKQTKPPGDFCPVSGQTVWVNPGPLLQSQGQSRALLASPALPVSPHVPLSVCYKSGKALAAWGLRSGLSRTFNSTHA